MPSGYEKSPYKHLLADKRVVQWIENAERGSPVTASEFLRRLGRICAEFDTTPQKLAAMSEKQAGDFMLDVISFYEKKKMAGSSVAGLVKTLKNYWSFGGLEIKKKVKVRDATNYYKYENERVPTREELGRILNMGEIRAKVACSLVAFGGFRLEVLGDYLGEEGLKIIDFPEMSIKHGTVEFSKVPARVRIRKVLSKTGTQSFTFIPQQACDYLKQYLEMRLRAGEKITPQSPIVTAQPNNPSRVGRHITTINIGDLMRKVIRKAGFDWRPYVLRRYFDTRMMQAESDGFIIRDWRVFWMNHKGDIEHTYTVDKGLTDDVIEKMREGYAKAVEKYLVTVRPESSSEEKLRNEFRKQLLLVAGFNQEEVDKMSLDEMTNEELQDVVRKRLLGAMVNNGNKQKVIPVSEVESYVANGWEFVAALPNERAVLKLPN